MCGIVGYIGTKNLANSEWLLSACQIIKHRGPDDEGIWESENNSLGFGQRRLSIIDLSPAGHQPMFDCSKNYCIVFNGEIYNYTEVRTFLVSKGHQFLTKTDTEVILEAYKEWGIDCLDHLNGMFAFAIFNKNNNTVLMARDRAGEKPLFYTIQNNTLYFASELKAILVNKSLSRKINYSALDCYLSLGFVPGHSCMLSGYQKLPPAHAMLFNITSSDLKIWKYWTVPVYTGKQILSIQEDESLVDELEHLLEKSVKQQLVADVPVGVLLSGGTDSSLITALAKRSTHNLKTFNIRFPGYGKYDETAHARLIANHFGTEHIELEAEESSADLLPILAKQYDEPIIDSSMLPTYLVSKLIRQHCTVAIGGDGGDELFGGYMHYQRLIKLQSKAGRIPYHLRKFLSPLFLTLMPQNIRGKKWIRAFGQNFNADVPQIAIYFDQELRSKLVHTKNDLSNAADIIYKNLVPSNNDFLTRCLIMDFENYLPEDILVKVDRASMLNSLEIRAPMLDRTIIEFAYNRVPPSLKASVFERKIILKKLAAKILPAEFDRNRKQGFSIPLGSWLKTTPWRQLFNDVLFCSDQNLFDKNQIKNLFDKFDGNHICAEHLFGLVMLELWRKEYNITL